MSALHVVFGAGPAGLATVDSLVRRGHRVAHVSAAAWSRSINPQLIHK